MTTRALLLVAGPACVLLVTTLSGSHSLRPLRLTATPTAVPLHITSTPSGLRVFVRRPEGPLRFALDYTMVVPESEGDYGQASARARDSAQYRGRTPVVLDLDSGQYVLAVEREFPPGAAEMQAVPRGCRNAVSFGGNTVSFGCTKCAIYAPGEATDAADPFARDGNVGVCFDAPFGSTATRYYRIYLLQGGTQDQRLDVQYRPKR